MAISPKVLVVNDDPGSLLGLVGLLSQWKEELSFEIVSARSGEEALRHVLRGDFAVILLDVNMPGIDGFETAQLIHSRKASASTPIIFVTAYLADELNRLRGYERGAADYLFTPIIPQILKAKVSVFVLLARKELELRHQAGVLDVRTRELTEINSSLEAEIEKRRIAEQKNKVIEEFLAMLGHELRNPLGAISNAASLLASVDSDTRQKAAATQIIQRQITKLSRIIDDLLDLGRVTAGKISLVKRSFDLSALVQSCMETLTLEGRTQQHTVSVQTEPAYVEADSVRMEQVVNNLLDNALKYTPAGGTIDIRVQAMDGEAVLTVRDSGIGVSRELLDRIFDVFVQGERARDRLQGGLGIGLALVRQLVGLHGGTVAAQSDGADKGSMFVVRLPKSMAPEFLSPEAAAYLMPDACRVLLIEDNPDGRESMSMMLSTFGHQVSAASDGHSGIEVAALERPEVALIDIGLPSMDGYEVARQLRANPDTCEIKLIALTGYGLESDRMQAFEAGFEMHLVKPVSPELLHQAICRCRRMGSMQ